MAKKTPAERKPTGKKVSGKKPNTNIGTASREGDGAVEEAIYAAGNDQDVASDEARTIRPIAPRRPGFPVVGIGASAGGLEALVTLLDNMPADRQSAELRDYFENLFDSVRHPLIVLDEQLEVVSANRPFCRTFDVRIEDIAGSLLYEFGHSQWDIPKLHELLEEVLPGNRSFDDFELEHDFRRLGRKRFLLSGRRVDQKAALPGLILLTIEVVSESKDP